MTHKGDKKSIGLQTGRRFFNGEKFRLPLFLLLNIVVLALFFGTIADLISLSLNASPYNHILLIPLVSGYFLFSAKKDIFSETGFAIFPGTIAVSAGLILFAVVEHESLKFGEDVLLSLMVLSLIFFLVGGFVLFFGTRAAKSAAFPLLFLLFMIPLPGVFLDEIVQFLTKYSAEVSSVLFSLTGIPVFREGAVFHIPGLVIEVAKECSGIRSSTVLFVTSVITGHMFLKTGWRKVALFASVLPITVFKNGLRIVTLALIGAYVDRGILSGALHRRGGIPFFIFALVLLGVVLTILRNTEKEKGGIGLAEPGEVK